MIKHPELVAVFENELVRTAPADFSRNLKIIEALYCEACLLGAFPLKDPLEGIEVDLRLAQVLNVRTPA